MIKALKEVRKEEKMNNQKKKSKCKVVSAAALALFMAMSSESFIHAESNTNTVAPNVVNAKATTSVNDFSFEEVGDGTYRITKYNRSEGVLVLPQTYQGKPISEVGETAFQFNTSVTSITIPEGYLRLGRFAFSMCGNLTSVTLPETLESMGENVFGFTGLTSINIPSKITEIPNLAFTNSKNLTSIVLGDNVTKIGDNAFFNCLALNSVKLSANLLSIGANAFAGRAMTALKGIVIPSSVTSIGSGAFTNSPAYVFVEANSQLDSTSLGNIQRPILVGNETDLLALQKKQPSIAASSGMVLNSMNIEGLPNGEVTIGSEFQLKAVAENTISPDGELKGSQNVKWSTTADPKVAKIDENTGVLKINGIGDLDFDITAVSKYGVNVVFGPNSGDFVDNSNGKLTSVSKSIKITSKEKAPDPVDPTPDPVEPTPDPIVPKPTPVDPNPITPIVPKPAPVEPISKPEDKNDSKTPDTGDTSNQLIWTSLLFGTIGSCVFLAKKRKED